MPESQLNHFLIGKGIKLISVHPGNKTHVWECEKIRMDCEVCPRCANPTNVRYGRCTVMIRDEIIRGKRITLRIRKHRYLCRTCRKPFTESVEGILPRRRTTQRLRKVILRDCDEVVNLSKVARRHFCSRSLVGKIFYEQMEIKLRERMSAKWPQVVGVDEHFFRRNKGFTEFATVFTDIGRRRMFEMGHSKEKKSLLEQVGHIQGRQNVTTVVMDLSRGYRSLMFELFPQAQVVADKFHVLRLLTPALIRTRKEIHGQRQDLKTRRQILRSREKLDYFERCDLDRYLRQHPKLEELYRYKEKLHQLYRTKGYKRAAQALEKLLMEMKTSDLEEIQRLAKTLRSWRAEVLEYFRRRYTNAFSEAMNSIAKLVQRRGCGYKNFKNYRLRTLSACPL